MGLKKKQAGAVTPIDSWWRQQVKKSWLTYTIYLYYLEVNWKENVTFTKIGVTVLWTASQTRIAPHLNINVVFLKVRNHPKCVYVCYKVIVALCKKYIARFLYEVCIKFQ
jgi:hypothetical protein